MFVGIVIALPSFEARLSPSALHSVDKPNQPLQRMQEERRAVTCM